MTTSAASLYNPSNPLMNLPELPLGVPALDLIQPEHFMPAVHWAVAKARANLAALRESAAAPTFENTVEALTFADADLDRVGAVFSNLSSAAKSEALAAIEEAFYLELSRYTTDLHMDVALFARVDAVYQRRDRLKLKGEQAMLLEEVHKSFTRNGVHLPSEQKARMKAINERLTELATQFENNDIKGKATYRCEATEADMAGVPDRAKEQYREAARQEGLGEGLYLIKIVPPPVDIMTHAANRSLREEIYKAQRTATVGGAYDNQPLIMEIVKLRHEKAQLLGFPTHADFVLSDRMAGSVATLRAFLEKNLAAYKAAAKRELAEFQKFARETDGLEALKPWDIAYYSNRLKEQRFGFKTEELRPYFELNRVMEGVRIHASRLFGIDLREAAVGVYPVYHPDVRVFEVMNKADGALIGLLYMDCYARPGTKQNGAWMNIFRKRGLHAGRDRCPLVTNNCNFAKPAVGKPTLLSLDDVLTVFHEFGHGLNDLLHVGRYPALAGTNVKVDFVELASQLMENWAKEPEVLASYALHHETGEVLPAALIEKLKASDTFDAGTLGLRQTFLAMLDLAFHATDPATIASPVALEKKVADHVLLMDQVYGLVCTGYTHIFSSQYDAGYYSYKWAEVLEADIFESFKQQGLYDADMGERLRTTIYGKGGTVPPMELYKEMMGREPDAEALFRREGLDDSAA